MPYFDLPPPPLLAMFSRTSVPLRLAALAQWPRPRGRVCVNSLERSDGMCGLLPCEGGGPSFFCVRSCSVPPCASLGAPLPSFSAPPLCRAILLSAPVASPALRWLCRAFSLHCRRSPWRGLGAFKRRPTLSRCLTFIIQPMAIRSQSHPAECLSRFPCAAPP